MTLGKRLIILVVLLAGVQVTTLSKLIQNLGWTTEPLQATIWAICFTALMLGSIVGFGAEGTQKYFLTGGMIIFLVEILANCLSSYHYALNHVDLPTALGYFAFLSSDDARRYIATIHGAALSVVALCYWLGVSRMLAVYQIQRQAEQVEQRQALREVDALLKQEAEREAAHLNGKE